jgi:signal transduction histidine kinase
VHHHVQPVDIREAVAEVLLVLEPALAAKRLDSVGDIPPDVRVAADPERLRGILRTLLSNAIRFNHPGGHVMVDVGYPQGMPEDVVMLRVGDSGCGIPRERQNDIFERTPQSPQRGDGSPGLPASRDWARAMGGDIRVRSDEGSGSVFTLTLPRAR